MYQLLSNLIVEYKHRSDSTQDTDYIATPI